MASETVSSDKPPVVSNDSWVWNNKVGSGGGNPWQNTGYRVTKLKVWSKQYLASSTKWGVTAVQIWIDGNEQPIHGDSNWGPEATTTDEISFASDEHISSMSIWAWDWVDSIRIQTNRQSFNAGGDGGSENRQSLGNGRLVGFQGNAGYRLDSIGSIFDD